MKFKSLILTITLVFQSILHLMAQQNVILIIADDIGTDYFGFYENFQDTVDVPNIRALLEKGIRFSNATSNPVCSSTRAGILTGRYSFRTGVGGIVGGEGGSNPLDTGENTIPRLLKKYNSNIGTANIGKWHLQQPMPMSNLKFPNIMGYDHFEGPFIGQLTSYTNWTKCTNGVNSTISNYATSENVNNAINWIKTQKGNPFFMWLAFNAPHDPIHLPPASLHHYNLSGTQQDIRNNPKKYYKAMIQAMDTEMGRLFDSLKVLNRFDSTTIIFIGDNGNTPRTAQIIDTSRVKGTIYQYGIHVPFIISGPSVVSPGRVSNALINTVDLLATIEELMGNINWENQIQPDKITDSKSIVPILRNEQKTIRSWAFSEIFKLEKDENDGKCIQDETYKLFHFDDGHEEFYNLETDPDEMINLLNLTLTIDDQTHNNYLCQELKNLLGSGIECKVIDNSKEDGAQFKIEVFPNPFDELIRINNASKFSNFQLMDIYGKTLLTGIGVQLISSRHLSKGVYILEIYDSGRRNTFKIIKKN